MGVQPDLRIEEAARVLQGGGRVAAAAAQASLSVRQLERRFLVATGVTPITYARTMRLQRFLATAGTGVSLAERAHAAGYADQSHLTRDTRRFTGRTPADSPCGAIEKLVERPPDSIPDDHPAHATALTGLYARAIESIQDLSCDPHLDD